MRFLLLLWLLPLLLLANTELFPSKECELFNNLKHTKNRGHEVLKQNRTYEMLKHHKGQYLLKVEYATPVQRWVDDNCLTLRPLRHSPLYAANRTKTAQEMNPTKVESAVSIEDELSSAEKNIAKMPKKYFKKKKQNTSSKQNLLALSWHNAFCETHRYKKECKKSIFSFAKDKYKEKHFVLHGLWPQPRNNIYCGVGKKYVSIDKHKQWNRLPDLGLSDDAKRRLIRVMPGFNSNLHRHEWIKHGTCYGTDAKQYYEDAVNLVEQLNDSKVGDFFSKNLGKHVTLQQIRALFNRSFGAGSGKRVELKCKGGLITELWLHLGSGSDDLGILLAKGKKIRSRCQGGMLDKAGF